MVNLNSVVMAGNITHEPEFKLLPSGRPVCKLRLAVNYKSKEYEETCFVNVDVFGRQAEICDQYLQKGKPVVVEGRLKLDTWQDRETGQSRSSHSIVANRVQIVSFPDKKQSDTTQAPMNSSFTKGTFSPNKGVSSTMNTQSSDHLSSAGKEPHVVAPLQNHSAESSVDDDIPF